MFYHPVEKSVKTIINITVDILKITAGIAIQLWTQRWTVSFEYSSKAHCNIGSRVLPTMAMRAKMRRIGVRAGMKRRNFSNRSLPQPTYLRHEGLDFYDFG